MSDKMYTEQQQNCIEALREAADQLGDSPTVREYVELGLKPSQNTIKKAFGTWNAAKEAAELSIRSLGGNTRININETYFEAIDSDEKAYWLGCLFCYSSQSSEDNRQRSLQLGRSSDKRHYVEGFADAVGSEYAINEADTGASTQITTVIFNQEFLDILDKYGLTDSAKYIEEYPDIPDKHEYAFMRAILENMGNVNAGSGGWTIRGRHRSQLEHLQEWVESTGVKRSTLSENSNGKLYLYISNTFDAATVFEAAWPDGLDTNPTHIRTARQYATRIAEEHHYPENLSFTPITESEPDSRVSNNTHSQSNKETSSQDTNESTETAENMFSKETDKAYKTTDEVTVPLSIDVALLIDSLVIARELEASEIVTKALRAYTASLLAGNTVQTDTQGTAADVVDRSFSIPIEFQSIMDASSEHLPLRTLIESAVQYKYAAEPNSVDIEVPASVVDDVPKNTDTITKSLSELVTKE